MFWLQDLMISTWRAGAIHAISFGKAIGQLNDIGHGNVPERVQPVGCRHIHSGWGACCGLLMSLKLGHLLPFQDSTSTPQHTQSKLSLSRTGALFSVRSYTAPQLHVIVVVIIVAWPQPFIASGAPATPSASQPPPSHRSYHAQCWHSAAHHAHRVEAIGDTWIRYGNQTYRRDRLGRPVGVPVWQFGR